MQANLVLGVIGSLVTLGVLFEMLRRRRLREKYAVFWAIVAVLTLVVAVFPAVLFTTADLLGVQVPANLLFFGASMVLLVVSIQHSHELGRIEAQSRTLAEEVGLLRLMIETQHGTTHPGNTARHSESLTADSAEGWVATEEVR
jgi:hypothetical protein